MYFLSGIVTIPKSEYNKSDWNSKGEIVAIVEDYGLMLNYQKNLENCFTSTQKISCLGVFFVFSAIRERTLVEQLSR